MLLEQIQDLQLKDVNGSDISVKDYRGKNTLIFMWASW